MTQVLAARDRKLAGPTAPAHGLVLIRVRYPDAPFEERRAGRAGDVARAPGRSRARTPPPRTGGPTGDPR